MAISTSECFKKINQWSFNALPVLCSSVPFPTLHDTRLYPFCFETPPTLLITFSFWVVLLNRVETGNGK